MPDLALKALSFRIWPTFKKLIDRVACWRRGLPDSGSTPINNGEAGSTEFGLIVAPPGLLMASAEASIQFTCPAY